jgi:hypothetical protein
VRSIPSLSWFFAQLEATFPSAVANGGVAELLRRDPSNPDSKASSSSDETTAADNPVDTPGGANGASGSASWGSASAGSALSGTASWGSASDARRSIRGGSCFLATADGWCVVTLARPPDLELLPALGALLLDAAVASGAASHAVQGGRGEGPLFDRVASAAEQLATSALDDFVALRKNVWPILAGVTARVTADDVVRSAALVGLAAARLGEAEPLTDVLQDARWGESFFERDRSPLDATGVRVVNLSSLWAGPLCAYLLGSAGASVLTVESPVRPEGLRLGDPMLFERLRSTVATIAVDLSARSGHAYVRDLLSTADVVIEGSRPRALAAMGCDLASIERVRRTRNTDVSPKDGGPRAWVSITAHGRSGPPADRIGFGDDAAAAGGLVVRDQEGAPMFAGDALADPLTGLTAALLVADRLSARTMAGLIDVRPAGPLDDVGSTLLDLPLARVAATFAPFAAELHDIAGGAR